MAACDPCLTPARRAGGPVLGDVELPHRERSERQDGQHCRPRRFWQDFRALAGEEVPLLMAIAKKSHMLNRGPWV